MYRVDVCCSLSKNMVNGGSQSRPSPGFEPLAEFSRNNILVALPSLRLGTAIFPIFYLAAQTKTFLPRVVGQIPPLEHHMGSNPCHQCNSQRLEIEIYLKKAAIGDLVRGLDSWRPRTLKGYNSTYVTDQTITITAV